jgi:hypothetical protein
MACRDEDEQHCEMGESHVRRSSNLDTSARALCSAAFSWLRWKVLSTARRRVERWATPERFTKRRGAAAQNRTNGALAADSEPDEPIQMAAVAAANTAAVTKLAVEIVA